jgi:hypothetical protein
MQYKLTKCNFSKLIFLFLIFYTLLHFSKPRVHLQEEGCIYSYGMVCFKCSSNRVLVGKPEGKRPLGRPRRRWEDNIMMHLQEVGGGCGDWMERDQDRYRWRALVSKVMNFRVP